MSQYLVKIPCTNSLSELKNTYEPQGFTFLYLENGNAVFSVPNPELITTNSESYIQFTDGIESRLYIRRDRDFSE